MNKRDLSILKDLERFRVLSRDDIAFLHFKHLKRPIKCCNDVLKRLRRDNQIEANIERQPYLYFVSPSPIKKDSAKIPHFLKIVDFYKSLLEYETPRIFNVEPKYGPKGTVEPDAFFIFRKAPFFLEIQRTVYSEKVMKQKIQRYENYFMSKEWENEAWQPSSRKIFPQIIMITDTRYHIDSPNIKVHQVQHIKELIKEPPKQEPIKIKFN